MHGFFYNSSIRQYIVLMGDLFSRVVVTREKDGKIIHQKVPISNSSRENFIKGLNKLNHIRSTEDVAKVETILPRMNINLVDMIYEPMKKTSMLKNTSKELGKSTQYNPVPYKFMFEVGIYTRYSRDMYQIVEQIFPYFQPHFTTQLTELHSNKVTIERDINVVLMGVSLDESTDGPVTDRRHLEWSLMFEVTGWIYPPSVFVDNQIRTIYLDFFGDLKETEDNFESIDQQVHDYVSDINKTMEQNSKVLDGSDNALGTIKLFDDDYQLTLFNNSPSESWTEDIKIPAKKPSRMRKGK